MDDVRELLRQAWEGDDFGAPAGVLKGVSDKTATLVLPGAPYSIATNVAHADIWQRLWLARLEGTPKFNPFPDFPAVEAKDWAAVRRSFLEHFEKACALASAEPFRHSAKSDAAARKLLTKIAVHNTYHVGQIVLLKRMARIRA